MALVVPVWMLGKGVTAATMTVLSLNTTTGALATASPGNNDLAELIKAASPFRALLDEVDFEYVRLTENVTPLNRVSAHHYPVRLATGCTLTEIMRAGHSGTTPNTFSNCLLANAWFAGRSAYVEVILTRGGIVGEVRTWTFYGIMEAFNRGFAHGKNVGRLTIGMADTTTAPTYT